MDMEANEMMGEWSELQPTEQVTHSPSAHAWIQWMLERGCSRRPTRVASASTCCTASLTSSPNGTRADGPLLTCKAAASVAHAEDNRAWRAPCGYDTVLTYAEEAADDAGALPRRGADGIDHPAARSPNSPACATPANSNPLEPPDPTPHPSATPTGHGHKDGPVAPAGPTERSSSADTISGRVVEARDGRSQSLSPRPASLTWFSMSAVFHSDDLPVREGERTARGARQVPVSTEGPSRGGPLSAADHTGAYLAGDVTPLWSEGVVPPVTAMDTMAPLDRIKRVLHPRGLRARRRSWSRSSLLPPATIPPRTIWSAPDVALEPPAHGMELSFSSELLPSLPGSPVEPNLLTVRHRYGGRSLGSPSVSRARRVSSRRDRPTPVSRLHAGLRGPGGASSCTTTDRTFPDSFTVSLPSEETGLDASLRYVSVGDGTLSSVPSGGLQTRRQPADSQAPTSPSTPLLVRVASTSPWIPSLDAGRGHAASPSCPQCGAAVGAWEESYSPRQSFRGAGGSAAGGRALPAQRSSDALASAPSRPGPRALRVSPAMTPRDWLAVALAHTPGAYLRPDAGRDRQAVRGSSVRERRPWTPERCGAEAQAFRDTQAAASDTPSAQAADEDALHSLIYLQRVQQRELDGFQRDMSGKGVAWASLGIRCAWAQLTEEKNLLFHRANEQRLRLLLQHRALTAKQHAAEAYTAAARAECARLLSRVRLGNGKAPARELAATGPGPLLPPADTAAPPQTFAGPALHQRTSLASLAPPCWMCPPSFASRTPTEGVLSRTLVAAPGSRCYSARECASASRDSLTSHGELASASGETSSAAAHAGDHHHHHNHNNSNYPAAPVRAAAVSMSGRMQNGGGMITGALGGLSAGSAGRRYRPCDSSLLSTSLTAGRGRLHSPTGSDWSAGTAPPGPQTKRLCEHPSSPQGVTRKKEGSQTDRHSIHAAASAPPPLCPPHREHTVASLRSEAESLTDEADTLPVSPCPQQPTAAAAAAAGQRPPSLPTHDGASTTAGCFWGYAAVLPACSFAAALAVLETLVQRELLGRMTETGPAGQARGLASTDSTPGRHDYGNGDSYVGYTDPCGQRAGLGLYNFASDGVAFFGYWDRGRPHGDGVLLLVDAPKSDEAEGLDQLAGGRCYSGVGGGTGGGGEVSLCGLCGSGGDAYSLVGLRPAVRRPASPSPRVSPYAPSVCASDADSLVVGRRDLYRTTESLPPPITVLFGVWRHGRLIAAHTTRSNLEKPGPPGIITGANVCTATAPTFLIERSYAALLR